jgi:hypothetical protein
MAEVNDQQAAYIRAGLAANPDLSYVSASTWGKKMGIYYYRGGGTLTADFNPVGKYKDWPTNDESFKAVVDPLIAAILEQNAAGAADD